MKITTKTLLAATAATVLLGTTSARADLVAHWKLDEANGDYSAGGIVESVRGTTVTVETNSGAETVTQGVAGLFGDGGTATRFTSGESRGAADPSNILAGSISTTGVHASGQADTGTAMVLGNSHTVTAWISPSVLSDNIGRTIFGAGTWNNHYNVLDIAGSSLRLWSGDRSVSLNGVLELNTPMFVVGIVNSAGVPDRPAGTLMSVAIYNPANDTWYHADGSGSPKNTMELWGMHIGSKYAGDIDDVRVYDTALTQAELDALVVVPEPGSLALLAMGGMCVLRRRRD